jgi:hypothetical protein
MALGLSITDAANGTGGTATITGSDSAQTATVYAQRTGTRTWQSAGSRSGNGTLALTLTPGYYFAYCQGTVSSVLSISPIIGQLALTTGTEAVHEKIKQAVFNEIVDIAPSVLPRIVDTVSGKPKVIVDVWPGADNWWNDPRVAFPGIYIWAWDREQKLETWNAFDIWGKPVAVAYLDRQSSMDTTLLPGLLRYREILVRKFNNQRLSAVSEVIFTEVEPMTIAEPKAGQVDLYQSSFLIRARTHEGRNP